MSTMHRKIAITGFNGFLASHIVKILGRDQKNIIPIPREVRTSTNMMAAWIDINQPNAIIHTAGLTDVRQCLAEPTKAIEVNVLQTANLLEAVRLQARNATPIPIIYVATDKSFGDQMNCGLETAFKPKFPYDMSKACEDMLVESYRQTYELPVATLRFPNFFGEGDNNDSRLLPSLCRAAISGNEFIIRTNMTGSTRQYIYVKDAAKIIVTTLNRQLDGKKVWPISHFGPPVIKSVGDVIADLVVISGRNISAKELNQLGESSHLSLIDQNGIGFAYTDWAIALQSTWNSYLEAAHANSLGGN